MTHFGWGLLPHDRFRGRGGLTQRPGAMSTKKPTKTSSKNRKKYEPSRLEDLEKIAAALDVIARRHLPDGVIAQGGLKGYEAEIRQEALLMAVGGFLQGNTGFRDARANRDENAIGIAMERCMAIALRIAKTRVASRLDQTQTRECQLTETNGGSCQHPSQCHPNNWPTDLKAQLIMRAVGKAVSFGQLSVANACIVFLICERGMAIKDVALVVKITRSAVYQQINRVRQVIPEVMESIEAHQF